MRICNYVQKLLRTLEDVRIRKQGRIFSDIGRKGKRKMDTNMKRNILLINDMPGYGKVALSAMFPILANMGYTVYNLPTALVSNTLDYGKFEIMETTDYMKNTIDVWEQLGFSFGCISTGFIVSEEQVKLITDYISKQKAKHPELYVVVDPIMGDDGALYNGVDKKVVSYMRELISKADVIIPNFTEAAFLADCYTEQKSLTQDEMWSLMKKLQMKVEGSVVITSIIESETNQYMVCGYDKKEEKYFTLPYHYIPVRFPGTGDIFSAVMTGKILDGMPLMEAVKAAMDSVEILIKANRDNEDKYKGIPIEECLALLEKRE